MGDVVNLPSKKDKDYPPSVAMLVGIFIFVLIGIGLGIAFVLFSWAIHIATCA